MSELVSRSLHWMKAIIILLVPNCSRQCRAKVKADCKLVQNDIVSQSETGYKVKRRDIYNEKVKNRGFIGGNDFEKLMNELQRDGVIEAIYFQDEYMKTIFNTYPTILLFDATYNLNDRRMPLVTLLAIDGNAESQIVGFFIVKSENIETMTSMFQEFKVQNEKWNQIEVILTDKAMTNIAVVANEFPNAVHHICIFHCKLYSFCVYWGIAYRKRHQNGRRNHEKANKHSKISAT